MYVFKDPVLPSSYIHIYIYICIYLLLSIVLFVGLGHAFHILQDESLTSVTYKHYGCHHSQSSLVSSTSVPLSNPDVFLGCACGYRAWICTFLFVAFE